MIWQAIFPVKRTLGIFSGDKSNITFVNKQEGSSKSKANRYWAAATVQNCVQEHIDYATQLGFSRAPGALHIFLTNWGITEGLASTQLFHI
jgi:type IV secretory pathway VirB6-like protein